MTVTITALGKLTSDTGHWHCECGADGFMGFDEACDHARFTHSSTLEVRTPEPQPVR